MIRIGLGTLFVLTVLVSGGNADDKPAAPGYHVIKKIPIEGDSGWDYVTFDPASRRLYIARATRVMVVDVDKGKLVGEVENTPGVHGVALVPKRNRGFISNGGDASVTVFDLKTLAEVGRIKVGKRPDAIIYDPSCDRVFTMNAGDKTATAIDAATEKVAGTVELGGKPESAVADEKGHIYVNLEDKHEILDFDANKLNVVHKWPVAPGHEPVGLAMDRAKRRLFSSCHNEKFVVMDADTGKVLASPPIGKGTDAATFDPETGFAFSSNSDGTLTIVKEDADGKYVVVENAPTQAGARTMALDPKTHNIIMVTAKPKAGQRRAFEPGTFVVLVVGQKDE